MSELDTFLYRMTARLSSVSGTLTAQTLRRIVLEAQGWHAPNDPKLAAGGSGIPCGGMTVNYVGEPDHWSPWLPWKGGPCPLPDRAQIAVEFRGGHTSVSEGAASHVRWRHSGERGDITRFRYRADNPAGWLPRGDWIPPAELWDEGCPVRVEWTCGMGWAEELGTSCPGPAGWKVITHIRLRPRHPKADLPEGWRILPDGYLQNEHGAVLGRSDLDRYGHPAIRQAVDAWLREMGDE